MPVKITNPDNPEHSATFDATSDDKMMSATCTCGIVITREKTPEALEELMGVMREHLGVPT